MQSTEPERLPVAVGVLFDQHGRVLISQRNQNQMHKGKWEFPGGKIQPGESVKDALARELFEELGVEVQDSEAYISYPFDYENILVHLNFCIVTNYNGCPAPLENQNIHWVKIQDLHNRDMLAGSKTVIESLQQEFQSLVFEPA